MKKIGKKIQKGFNNIKKRFKPDDYSSFNTPEVIMLIIVSILFGTVVGCILTYGKVLSVNNSDKKKQELIEAYERIRDNYYEDVSEDELINAAVNGMVSILNDPYSYYMDSDETNSFNQKVDGSYVGIGTTVSHVVGVGNKVVDMFDDSPAAKAGVKIGDIFVSIDGVDVKEMTLSEISNYIKGKEKSTSDFVFLRDGEEIKISITRDTVEIPSVSSKIIEKDNIKIGYVNIETFASNTYLQFEKNLKSLEKNKINSLIIDVRDNPGGHLGQVESILSLFFNKKTVLYQLETKGKVSKIYSSNNTTRKYDVVVLINKGSASASEILASCFKENYTNATVVGVSSYGKGTVQKAIELSTGASLKYTIQKWLTSKGEWIDGNGVVPDVVVEQGEDYYNTLSEDDDLQLHKALEILLK